MIFETSDQCKDKYEVHLKDAGISNIHLVEKWNWIMNVMEMHHHRGPFKAFSSANMVVMPYELNGNSCFQK